MSVYFVYRCHYAGPTEKYLKRFDDDSVLDWVRNRWHRLRSSDVDKVNRDVDREIGFRVYSLFDIFWDNPEHPAPEPHRPPTNARQLRDLFTSTYHNEIVCESEHCIQVETDDDELDMAYYFFDDHYLKEHGDRAAFLLYDHWQLPSGHGPGPYKASEPTRRRAKASANPGATYAVFIGFYNSGGNLEDMDNTSGGERFDGVRLPDFPRFLMRKPIGEDWPRELVDLRPILPAPSKNSPAIERQFLHDLRADPADDVTWNAYSDWLQDRGELPAGPYLLRQALTRLARTGDNSDTAGVEIHDLVELPIEEAYQQAIPFVKRLDRFRSPGKSLIHVEEHLAQMCLYVGHDRWQKCDLFHQWIFFDDLWAAAHPALANAILSFGRRWDVLTTKRKNPPGMS